MRWLRLRQATYLVAPVVGLLFLSWWMPPSGQTQPTWPTPATTGPPAGAALTPSGGITVTTPGAVVESRLVTGCITVEAPNVTIRDTRVLAAGCVDGIKNLGHPGLVVEDTEIDGQSQGTCAIAIGDNNYTAIRVHAHGCSDGARISDGDVTIRDSVIGPTFYVANDHGDGIQCYYGRTSLASYTRNVIRHNTIIGGNNSAIQVADHCHGSLMLDDNLLSATGGYTLRLYDFDATVTNNVFVRGAWGSGPVHHYVDPAPGASDPGATVIDWSDNRISDHADGTGLAETVPPP
jgi:hypothetical protein